MSSLDYLLRSPPPGGSPDRGDNDTTTTTGIGGKNNKRGTALEEARQMESRRLLQAVLDRFESSSSSDEEEEEEDDTNAVAQQVEHEKPSQIGGGQKTDLADGGKRRPTAQDPPPPPPARGRSGSKASPSASSPVATAAIELQRQAASQKGDCGRSLLLLLQQQQNQRHQLPVSTSLSQSFSAETTDTIEEDEEEHFGLPPHLPHTTEERGGDSQDDFMNAYLNLPPSERNTNDNLSIQKIHVSYHANNPDVIIRTLTQAALHNDVTTLKLLLDDAGIEFILRHGMIDMTTGRTLFWRGCYAGATEFVDLLAKKCLEHWNNDGCGWEEEEMDDDDDVVPEEDDDEDDDKEEEEEEEQRAMTKRDYAKEALVELLEMETRWGSSPILIAAARNHPRCITTLLNHNINPNSINAHGCTPAIIAASQNNVDILRALGQDTRVDFNKFHQLHLNPVLVACQRGNVEALRYLYEFRRGTTGGVDVDSRVVDFGCNVVDERGYGCVGLAALHNQADTILYLSSIHNPQNKMCPDINQRFFHEIDPNHPLNGDTPLHIASRNDNYETVAALLRCPECDITARNLQGMTALHLSVLENKLRTVKRFASSLPPDQFALLDAEDIRGMTPLYAACSLGLPEMVEVLATPSDTSVMCRVDNAGGDRGSLSQPPLLAAVVNDHVETVTALLASGADVNQTDEAGHTAVSIAARAGYFRMCQVLVMNRADLTIRSKKGGGTPVQKARKYKHYKIVELLEKYGG